MKKILHITNWYPNKWNDIEAIFIQEQFRLFSTITDSSIINIQVRPSDKWMEYKHIKYSDNEEGYYLLTKIKSNKIIELITSFLLIFVLFKSNYKRYDLLHFHIAYPLLTYYHLWKKIIKIPLIISEHWSAYHFNFYMPKDTKKLDNIKRIFRQNIPLICVSKALVEDIEVFANATFRYYILPNVIDMDYFYLRQDYIKRDIPRFFAVNNWRDIKNPFEMLDGFLELHNSNIDFILVIGGYGELMDDIKSFVYTNNMTEKVIFYGKMDKLQIADELSQSDAYICSSYYETFSVVSAQALCCGNVLISPPIDAILEYTDDKSHIKIAKDWSKKLQYFIEHRDNYSREYISQMASNYLSHKSIQNRYKDIVDEISR